VCPRRRPEAVPMARSRPTQGAADSSSVSDLGAAESGRCETAVAEMLCSKVDGSMLIAARAVDHRLEPKRCDFAEGGEGQRVKHAPTLDRQRRAA
jgi:hypothetical protein